MAKEIQDSEGQAIEVYRCRCGETFTTLDGREGFRAHLLHASHRDGKGTHKSQGRVNKETGEITMPPWEERTPEQKAASQFGRKVEATIGGRRDGKKPATALSPLTNILTNALEIKFVPRVYTSEFTPIMRAGMSAAMSEWGWAPDITLGDFLDTVIYNFFKDRRIHLGGYVIEEDKEKEEVVS